MFCPKCGKEITKGTDYCYECGATLNEEKKEVVDTTTSTTPAFVWGLIGFFVPIAGLILFIMWKQDRPKDAKAAGVGALIWIGLYALMIILTFVFAFVASMASY